MSECLQLVFHLFQAPCTALMKFLTLDVNNAAAASVLPMFTSDDDENLDDAKGKLRLYSTLADPNPAMRKEVRNGGREGWGSMAFIHQQGVIASLQYLSERQSSSGDENDEADHVLKNLALRVAERIFDTDAATAKMVSGSEDGWM